MLLRFQKELFSAERVHYLSVCVSLGLSWEWVKYCMVRLDGCRVVPTGQDKAGGGILLPQDDPGMGMCNCTYVRTCVLVHMYVHTSPYPTACTCVYMKLSCKCTSLPPSCVVIHLHVHTMYMYVHAYCFHQMQASYGSTIGAVNLPQQGVSQFAFSSHNGCGV